LLAGFSASNCPFLRNDHLSIAKDASCALKENPPRLFLTSKAMDARGIKAGRPEIAQTKASKPMKQTHRRPSAWRTLHSDYKTAHAQWESSIHLNLLIDDHSTLIPMESSYSLQADTGKV